MITFWHIAKPRPINKPLGVFLMGLYRFRQRAIMDEGDTVGDDRKSSKHVNANDAQFKVAAYA